MPDLPGKLKLREEIYKLRLFNQHMPRIPLRTTGSGEPI